MLLEHPIRPFRNLLIQFLDAPVSVSDERSYLFPLLARYFRDPIAVVIWNRRAERADKALDLKEPVIIYIYRYIESSRQKDWPTHFPR